jgi:predicted ribosome quality control (RQC) complex YloA/Tae2 family protein
MSPGRPVLPGLFYRLPPPQDKRDPFALSAEECEALFAAAPPEARVADWLLGTFGGISPLLLPELAHRIGGASDCRFLLLAEESRKRAPQVFTAFLNDVRAGRFVPTLLSRGGEPADFSCVPIAQYGPETAVETLPSFSVLLDRFYGERELHRRMAQRSADMRKNRLLPA